MVCPKCKIELRAKQTEDGRTVLVCRNPKCENYKPGIIVKEIK